MLYIGNIIMAMFIKNVSSVGYTYVHFMGLISLNPHENPDR